MLSLAERHEDRAKRKAANKTEYAGNAANSTGTVALLAQDFIVARAALTDAEREEVDALAANFEAGLGGARSLAEAPDGSGDTMAGIGVVNTKVVPSATLAAQEGNGGGASVKNDAAWGAIAPATVKPIPEAPALDPGTNLNGQALVDQGAVTPVDGTDGKTEDKA